ncbi:MAG: spondin domain-containing protein [Pseudomonadota bacterium]
MTDIRITARNTSSEGGTFLTPVWFAFHDNSFDLYDRGVASSAGLESLAEDGSFDTINGEVAAVDADAQVGAVTGAAGPVATQEVGAAVVDVDASSNAYVDVAAMILPSNDAFIGTGTSIQLFDDEGNFIGTQRLIFNGENVLDAGTEVNTELDAAFINQTGPNTGETENGVVTSHPGFNGSFGNPEGEGDQIILGGTNAFGVAIDPEAADFTLEGARVATVHINLAETYTGDETNNRFTGSRVDDLIDALGGNDVLFGRLGWDDIDGGEGNDRVFGNRGIDILSGGAGDDTVAGGRGADEISGNGGNDVLRGGLGADSFNFGTGYGTDLITDFGRGNDQINLGVDGIEDFDDVLAAADDTDEGALLDFGDGDSLLLAGVAVDDLAASDFAFV